MRTYCISIVIALSTFAASQTQYTVTIREPIPQWHSGSSGINASGALVGTARPPLFGQSRAFIYIGERVRILDTLARAGQHVNDDATDVNDGWDVVGVSENAARNDQAVMWRRARQLIELGTLPGMPSSIAFGINNHQQVVGVSGGKSFFWQNGVMSELPKFTPNLYAQAYAINNSGLIVGYSWDRAVYWDAAHNVFAIPMAPGWVFAKAWGVNDDGAIVGHGTDDTSSEDIYSDRQAFVYKNGILTVLPGVSNKGYWATGINSDGTVVGTYSNQMFTTEGGFVYKDGISSDLAPMVVNLPAGWTILGAGNINDAGEISGTVQNPISGLRHAAVFRPL